MYNRAIIIGRLTKEPELKQTAAGKSVCSFTVAVNRRYSRDETDFLECVAWQKTAEFLCQYFHKGNAIGVEGAIQTRRYEDRNGNTRTAVEVVADNMFFVESKSASRSVDVEYSTPSAPAKKAPVSDYEEIEGEDDLPF